MCVYVCILTVILLPVDYSGSSQSDEILSVFFGHGGAEHLERAQFALRHWEQTDQTQTDNFQYATQRYRWSYNSFECEIESI